MNSRKFATGERVMFRSTHSLAAVAVVTVLRPLPKEDQIQTYRIKSADERCERVARECELSRIDEK